MNIHEKRQLVLYQQLQGAGYFNALSAFQFASRSHKGTRKDGITPEFSHQIEIALFALLLPDLLYREETIATIALHDVREDFGISDGEIRSLFRDPAFADRVAHAVHAMTKKYRGVIRDLDELFAQMALDPIASIAKGCDRQHNILSMIGVFTPEKQRQYVGEVRSEFLPMLKTARRNFPHQIRAYELLKFNLETQIELIEAALDAKGENDEQTRTA